MVLFSGGEHFPSVSRSTDFSGSANGYMTRMWYIRNTEMDVQNVVQFVFLQILSPHRLGTRHSVHGTSFKYFSICHFVCVSRATRKSSAKLVSSGNANKYPYDVNRIRNSHECGKMANIFYMFNLRCGPKAGMHICTRWFGPCVHM